jgi:hypothetical protein
MWVWELRSVDRPSDNPLYEVPVWGERTAVEPANIASLMRRQLFVKLSFDKASMKNRHCDLPQSLRRRRQNFVADTLARPIPIRTTI